MKSGSTTSFSTCKGNWRLAHPFTKPCEEVICLERIMPTAVAAYIIAEKYQVATEDSSLGIVVDTALSAVSIPLLIVAFQYYGLL